MHHGLLNQVVEQRINFGGIAKFLALGCGHSGSFRVLAARAASGG
jgi:hypothetical protein